MAGPKVSWSWEQQQYDVEIAITEAWRWVEINMFILPAPGINGQNRWFVLGRRGRAALAHPEQFVADSKAAARSRRQSAQYNCRSYSGGSTSITSRVIEWRKAAGVELRARSRESAESCRGAQASLA